MHISNLPADLAQGLSLIKPPFKEILLEMYREAL